MRFILEDEVEEIQPVEELNDRAIVITPTVGKRGESESELVKEITALDALMIGPSAAAKINGVPVSSASKYSDGKDVSEDTRVRILSKKHNIQDLAVTKLMDTLNLIDPSEDMKIRDRIAMVTGLSTVVDKLSDKGNQGGTQVVLHLYAPEKQKKESDYDVIDV